MRACAPFLQTKHHVSRGGKLALELALALALALAMKMNLNLQAEQKTAG